MLARESAVSLTGITTFVFMCSVLIASCQLPSDSTMMKRFRAHQPELEAVAESVNKDVESGNLPKSFLLSYRSDRDGWNLTPKQLMKYRPLLARCCPDCNLFRDEGSGAVMFLASSLGVMLKGSYKGFAYSRVSPKSVFPALDGGLPPEDCKFHFRPITDHWYLYYQSCP